MKQLLVACLLLFTAVSYAGELAGVRVPDKVTLEDQQELQLNGMGLREKLWIDVYVGSLYLSKKATDMAAILAQPGGYRVRLDIIYHEISASKLVDAWMKGFTQNMTPEEFQKQQPSINHFINLFGESARKGDIYLFDYLPGRGVQIHKNGVLLGSIEDETLRIPLLDIWLGNHPASKQLKSGMMGHQP